VEPVKSSTERKVIAVFIFGVVGASVLWGIHGVIAEKQSLEAAAEAGWVIDYSWDPLQRDLRITLALLLGAVALWSRRGTKAALIAGLVAFAGIEFITWSIAPRNTFHRIEIEFHVLGGALLVFAAILWMRGANDLMIAILAPAYVLLEFVLWFVSTIRMKALLGVDRLEPPTVLNNFFSGAHWWDLLPLPLSLLMILFSITAARKATFR
jgi:hypothetical protein